MSGFPKDVEDLEPHGRARAKKIADVPTSEGIADQRRADRAAAVPLAPGSAGDARLGRSARRRAIRRTPRRSAIALAHAGGAVHRPAGRVRQDRMALRQPLVHRQGDGAARSKATASSRRQRTWVLDDSGTPRKLWDRKTRRCVHRTRARRSPGAPAARSFRTATPSTWPASARRRRAIGRSSIASNLKTLKPAARVFRVGRQELRDRSSRRWTMRRRRC